MTELKEVLPEWLEQIQRILDDLNYHHQANRKAFLQDCAEDFDYYDPFSFNNASDTSRPNIEEYMDSSYEELTIGFSWDEKEGVTGTAYQIGDNSFIGPAYSYPHWIVLTLVPGAVAKDYEPDIEAQFDSLIFQ